MNYTFSIIMALIGLGSLGISFLMYQLNKGKISKLETNHFAHLEAEVNNHTEEINRLREDITKLFDKCEKMQGDISFIRGKLNGSLK